MSFLPQHIPLFTPAGVSSGCKPNSQRLPSPLSLDRHSLLSDVR